MLFNLMGKRIEYDKRFTKEIRSDWHKCEELFYYQDVMKKHFRSVEVECWGVKLSVSVDAKFAHVENVFEFANLCKELCRIENGIKCANEIDWYAVVKNELKELHDKAEQIQKEDDEWDARLKKETAGMTTKQIWDWIEDNQKIKNWDEGNIVKKTRKAVARLEEKRRWEMKVKADRQRLIEWRENRKPKSERQKSKPKAVAKQKKKQKVVVKKEKEMAKENVVDGQVSLF